MDLDIVSLFTRPGTYVLGISIFIATFFFRKIVETLVPRLKKQADENAPGVTYLTATARWWNDVFLHLLPVLAGAVSGIMRSEFFFAGIGDKGGRVLFGIVVGWFSSFLYKLLQRVIQQRLGVNISPDADSTRPPPLPTGPRSIDPPTPPGAA